MYWDTSALNSQKLPQNGLVLAAKSLFMNCLAEGVRVRPLRGYQLLRMG